MPMKCHTPKNFPKLSYTFYILSVIYLFVLNNQTDPFYHLSQTQICSFLPWPQTMVINQLPPCLVCKIFLNFYFTKQLCCCCLFVSRHGPLGWTFCFIPSKCCIRDYIQSCMFSYHVASYVFQQV